jgi:hypothetical protein
MRFDLYQLKAPAIDGRGVGWFHTGDFDDWTTETFVYQRTPDALHLTFPIRHERFTSPVVDGEAEGRRVLDLLVDPRNFWHRRAYVDGGKSFVYGMDLPFSIADIAARGE